MDRRPMWLVVFVFVAAPAFAADVTIQLDAGDGLSVRNNTGAIERLRVDEATGNVSRNGALFVHTTGGANLFVGPGAGNAASMAGGNTGIGISVLPSNTSIENTGVGYRALSANTTGNGNVAVGGVALQYNTTAAYNTAVGLAALRFNTTGSLNTAVGNKALRANTDGDLNTGVGYAALRFNTTGNNNSAFGGQALSANQAGVNNSAFGGSALRNNTASSNSAFGFYALSSNISGGNNSAFGNSALDSNTTGSSNSAFGIYALQNNTASNNAAFGASALRANTVGVDNAALGHDALLSNTTGLGNSALGKKALNSNTAGSGNTAFGQNALFYNSTGNRNVAVGQSAGNFQTTGSDNIYLANAGVAGEAGQIKIGTVGVHTRASIAGIHGIAIPSGSSVFINANGLLGTASISSARFKQDVRDMGEASDLLMRLRPVTFRYREDAVADPEDAKIPQYGLVAEEVAEVAPELVTADADGRPYTVKYHELPALLLNEVQVQRRTIATLEARIAELEKRPLYTEPREVAR